jgi:hypothetical protein
LSAGLAARWLPGSPPGWRELLRADPTARFAHDPEVLRALADVLPSHEARYLVLEREATLVGGLPVLVERRAGWTWWHALPRLLPGAPLALPGSHQEVDATCAVALRDAMAQARALGGEWVGYRPEGPPALAALEQVPGETRVMTAFLVDLSGGLDAAWARADRETRRGIRQARERGVVVAAERAALEEGYALHRAQARGWRGYQPLPLELSRRLLGVERSAFLVAREEGRLLAGVLAFASAGEGFVWWSGARPEARPSRAYAALLWGAVEWAHGLGCARLNLGASAGREAVEGFKRDLGAQPHDYPVRWLAPMQAGPAGRLVLGMQAWRRRGRSRGRAA